MGTQPTKFFYQILTTPTGDTPGTAVLLNFPDKRYLFGQISEGTQRACIEIGVRVSHVTDIFLTGRTGWHNNGGLIGMILTLADSISTPVLAASVGRDGAQKLNVRGGPTTEQNGPVHGPPTLLSNSQITEQRGTLTIHGGRNLTHTLATTRRFVFRTSMPLFTREYGPESDSTQEAHDGVDQLEQPTWSDTNIKVWAMPITPLCAKKPSLSGSSPRSPRKRRLDEFQEVDEGTLSQAVKDHLTRQSVVSDMFNSHWRMDSLIEMPLANVKIPATIFVRNPETKDIDEYRGPMPGDGKPLPDIKVLVRLPWPGATIEKLPTTTQSEEALSYIIRNHDVRGKFDPKKAQELKVRKGPDYARLTRGFSVQSEDGKTIHPDMVLGTPRLGRGVAIIDLPTSDYVEGLVTRREWMSPAVTTGLEAFVWVLGPGVGEHPQLQEFVRTMSHCKHIVSSVDRCPNYLSMHSAAGSAIRLAKLNSDTFAIPVHDNVTLPQSAISMMEDGSAFQNSLFQPAERGLIVDMEPTFGLNRENVIPFFNPARMLERIPRVVEKRIAAIHHRIRKETFQKRLRDFQKGLPGSDVEIFTLGTGSSAPSKYRNVSATLVKVPQYGYYLLDCGENTLGQLKRVFKPDQLKEVFRDLRMIWISHLHADHHLGTVSVIRAWYNENHKGGNPIINATEMDMAKILQEKRLFVVSEEMMISWLEEYASVDNYGFEKLVPLVASQSQHANGDIKTKFLYRHCRNNGTYPNSQLHNVHPPTTTLRFDDPSSPFTPFLRSATRLSDLLTTRVSHCRGAMAASFVFPDGFKLSYSGDCRPSASFTAIGRDSTVLIHEATFQDDMAGSALAKKHCTTTEALEVGREMRARTIVLTHFSQRYQKVARISGRQGAVKNESPRGELPMSVASESVDAVATEPKETPGLVDTSLSSRDDLTISQRSRFRVRSLVGTRQNSSAPVAVAFDYMRLRIGDIPIAQEYAPAFEKLFEIMERTSLGEVERSHGEGKEAATSMKKRGKQKGKARGNDVGSGAVDPSAMTITEGKERSAWSASESESGWTVSESEGEMMAG